MFTSGFRPPLKWCNGIHRFLNSALGIYCEHHQVQWEEYLQLSIYAHNAASISGTSNITPFFLVFGRDPPSPEAISLELPPKPLPPDHYAKHISRLTDANKKFNQVKADLRRCQRDVYDTKAHHGKLVHMHKIPSHKEDIVSRFTCSFDGPYLVIGHPFKRPDMLT